MVFFVAAGIYAVGGVLYLILARGKLQDWAVDPEETDLPEKNIYLKENGEAEPMAPNGVGVSLVGYKETNNV